VERSGSAAFARERLAAGPVAFPGQFPLVARRVREAEVWEQPARTAPAQAIPVGSRVFHQKFGYGTVTAAEDHRLDISFEKAGPKRLLDSYVEPA
jgi:DNA helicase-2/ATP-dependent DNA helicase PcrA